MSNSQKSTIGFQFPEELRYLIIDIGPKRMPIIPPIEEPSLHVLAIEPVLEFAYSISQISTKLHVLPSSVGENFGVRNTLKASNFNYSDLQNKRHKQHPIQMRTFIPVIPFDQILKNMPENTEIFIRADESNFDLKTAQSLGHLWRRVTLFKKRFFWDDNGEENENVVLERNNFVDLLLKEGLELIKIDKISSNMKDLVWINNTIRFSNESKQSILLKTLNYNENSSDVKLIKIKNFIKNSFSTLFFGTDPVWIYRDGGSPFALDENSACWRVYSAISKKLPNDAFLCDVKSDVKKIKNQNFSNDFQNSDIKNSNNFTNEFPKSDSAIFSKSNFKSNSDSSMYEKTYNKSAVFYGAIGEFSSLKQKTNVSSTTFQNSVKQENYGENNKEQNIKEENLKAENLKEKALITHAFFKGGLHCGHAPAETPSESLFCWSKYQLITSDHQVLCGSGFAWARPQNSKIPDWAVIGGKENTKDNLYVTRVCVEGEYFFGKVCPTWLVKEGDEQKLKCQYYHKVTNFTDDFEVLVRPGNVQSS